MEKIIFKDSRAIKITNEMRNALNLYNQKKHELEQANEEVALLEKSRKEKDVELESLNIKSLDTDKKVAKDASKRIKIIDKEINKFQNDIQKANDRINKLLEKNKPINMPEVTLKAFKDFGKVETKEENINIEAPIIQNDIQMPEIKIDKEEAALVQDNNELNNANFDENITPIIEDQSVEAIVPTPEIKIDNEVSEEPIINMPDIVDDSETKEEGNIEESLAEEENSSEVSTPEPAIEPNGEIEPIKETVEPVVLENGEDNIEIASEESKLPEENVTENTEEAPIDDEIVVNPFLSQEGVDKMWNELNKKEEPKEEVVEETIIEETNEDTNEENEENAKEEKTKTNSNDEIKKPDIFGKNSEFAKLADKVVSPSPLIPEGSDISLIPFDDYNEYVFKFGQDHYGKEALTPKEISDLSNIENFLDSDTFEVERSKQYKNIESENEELKNRISSIDDDYKKQVSDMRKEHFSNLDNLGNLIDKANDIISDNRTKISNLEDDNKNLNNTINNQTNEITSLNKTKDELEKTIENLNNNIDELQKIKKEQEDKIKNYEDKFKEVLGIVKEVKTDN